MIFLKFFYYCFSKIIRINPISVRIFVCFIFYFLIDSTNTTRTWNFEFWAAPLKTPKRY